VELSKMKKISLNRIARVGPSVIVTLPIHMESRVQISCSIDQTGEMKLLHCLLLPALPNVPF
jgi:hypothetical protein